MTSELMLRVASLQVDVGVVVNQVLDTMRHMAKAGVQVVSDLHPAPKIIGDSSRLSQVLMNLLGNALKFTQKGTVTITVAPAQNGEQIHLIIADTGIGIHPDKHVKIFQAFEQASLLEDTIDNCHSMLLADNCPKHNLA